MIMDRTGLSAEIVVKELSLQMQVEAQQAATESPWAGLLVDGIATESAPPLYPEEEEDQRRLNEEQLNADDPRVIQGEVVKEEPRVLPPAPPPAVPGEGSAAGSFAHGEQESPGVAHPPHQRQ